MINITYQVENLDSIQQLRENIQYLLTHHIEVGIQSSTRTRATSRKRGGESMAAIAFENEYGNSAKRIPARPFRAITIQRSRNRMTDLINYYLGQVVLGRMEAREAMTRIGFEFQTQMARAILSNILPENAPMTIALKKSSRTLIDTGQMLNSVRSVIRRNTQRAL